MTDEEYVAQLSSYAAQVSGRIMPAYPRVTEPKERARQFTANYASAEKKVRASLIGRVSAQLAATQQGMDRDRNHLKALLMQEVSRLLKAYADKYGPARP